ncbi:MAG TPA: NAD-dependent epimerase/dehydratase family protein, partial [Solirubrobacterales bacterium]
MKVLVSGASGFIGSALCDSLLVRDDTVVGLTRDPKRARSTNPNVSWHAWEPTLERPPAAAFEGVDGVVNLLGEKINQRWTDEAKWRIMESRRTGTHNLIGTIAGLEKRPRVLVNQSAIGYYGDRGEAIVDESSEPGQGFDAEVVREWEKAAHEVDPTGVRLAIVRTGHVLDAHAGFLKPQLTPFKLGVGGPLAGGNQYVSWIHVQDEVGILL